jgi:hypothetical protein
VEWVVCVAVGICTDCIVGPCADIMMRCTQIMHWRRSGARRLQAGWIFYMIKQTLKDQDHLCDLPP